MDGLCVSVSNAHEHTHTHKYKYVRGSLLKSLITITLVCDYVHVLLFLKRLYIVIID